MAAQNHEKREAVDALIELLKAGEEPRSKDTFRKWKVAKLMAEVRALGIKIKTTKMIPKKTAIELAATFRRHLHDLHIHG